MTSMWITNGTLSKRIEKSELIPEGWVKGRSGSSSPGLVWITNGTLNKKIDPNIPIEKGWVKGRSALTTSGRVTVNNGLTNKIVEINELDSYLSDGWQKGMKPQTSRKKIIQTKEEIDRLVVKRQATYFLKTGYKTPAQNPDTKKKPTLAWEFVEAKLKSVHGDRYEYDKESYISDSNLLRVKCSNHGWFESILSNLKKEQDVNYVKLTKQQSL